MAKKGIHSFKELEVWKQARKVQRLVKAIISTFPKSEQYLLTDQLIRSSRSIAGNIAEGYGRYHYQENIHLCRIARGSLSEVLNDVITAFEEGYIDKTTYDELRKEIETNNRLLNGYISYLKKAEHGEQTNKESMNYTSRPDNK